MPNRYDSPAQAQFMQTYVPVPFEEILQAGLSKQKAYDTNRLAFEQGMAETQNLGYIPNSEDQGYIESLKGKLESVRDKYIDKDYSNPEVVRQIYKDINSNVNRNLINRIQRSYEGYKQYQQQAAKATSEGKSLFHPYDFTGYSTENRGIFAELPEPLHDWRKKEETYFDQIEPDSYTDRDTGETFSVVNKQKVLGLAQAGLADYVNSTEGRQKLRDFIQRGGTREDAEKYMLQSLYNTGIEKLQRRHQDWAPEHVMRGREEQSIILPGEGNTQALINKNINPDNPLKGTALENVSFDKAGNPLEYKNYKQSTDAPTALQMITQSTGMGQYVAPMKVAGVDKGIKDNQIKLLNDIGDYTVSRDESGKVTGTPLKYANGPTKVAALSQARQNLARIDNKKAMVENLELKKRVTTNILSDLKSRLLFPTESDEPVEITTPDDLFKKAGVKRQEGDNVIVNGIVPSRGTYDMSIIDKDGFPKATFEVSLNPNEREPIMPLIKASEIHNKGIPGAHSFKVGKQTYIVATSIEPIYDEESGRIIDYTFSSNVGPVTSSKPDKEGNYDYLQEPVPLDQLDKTLTDQFRALYSGKKR